MFTVRFGGETWHQFAPLLPDSRHPVFFALSCHTNELGGNLTEALKAKVLGNEASIPALTELLPAEVASLMDAARFDAAAVPTTTLSLDAPAGSLHRLACKAVRGSAGLMRGAWGKWRRASGFLTYGGSDRAVRELGEPACNSLLRNHLNDLPIHHEDTFRLRLTAADAGETSAAQLLALVLEGFMQNSPGGVSSLMALRNFLVRPLGLRTSPLGCPVSSLLAPSGKSIFARRFPVLDQRINAADRNAEVILGADDRHLIFRSCVSVNIVGAYHIDISLGTRVHCKNLFGRFYMAAIDFVHRHYVSPSMLRLAAEHAAAKIDVAHTPIAPATKQIGAPKFA
jgi:hypothetical protein